MSILREIYEYKLNFVKNSKNILPQKEIEKQIKDDVNKSFCFSNKLRIQKDDISIIGEIKKASPSLGKFVKNDIDLVALAETYEMNNISCLSVLTDEKYFQGNINDLKSIRTSTSIPILRKDFIVDEYQIYESKLVGADCILIILSMINQKDAEKFASIALDMQMDTIIEIHDFEELKRAQKIKSNMIGINNRNLNNFVTDLNTTIKLSNELKDNEKLIISESGFHGRNDINKIINATGINNFLIGEYLMKSPNLSQHIKKLLN